LNFCPELKATQKWPSAEKIALVFLIMGAPYMKGQEVKSKK